ncbi:1,3-beta-glucanosyltransferase [Ophidiomyces ophidiicola]|nr:1,3-beta-glucanosyltransferase [Ophidiomyces ophidiicola]KAI1981569.1 1,3-beta-glucanosyltransferase [Ophidiomyces ophidiicola]KAI1983648.1 1,3-beta-glucanosyltransferase [Ophidiomyces ophidiicola]KAI1989361.1 1,3-beta-glucanosyltransferase [Ophidiomyces ophidiicola]
MKASVLSLVAATALGASTALAKTDPVTVKGNAFFAGNNRFYVRGVDYQPGGTSKLVDPLADPTICKRDIEYFKKLGLNTVRIYTVDNSKSHEECMRALSDAGIYLVLDVNTPKYSINRNDPAPSYNDVYLQNVFATVDLFAKYDNTLAFFSGNEVINDEKTSSTAPYIKAVTRDIRQYIRNRKLREIPVGYSAADVSANRLETAQYMNCGSDDERSDFFAFNDYSWCSPSSFTGSGWDQKVKNFTGYGLPLFLSEYGCNTNKRDFGEVASLYSDSMTGVYSGGLAYEYTQEANNYGLVKIKGNNVEELPDFEALRKAFAGTKNPSGDGGYNSRGGSSNPCPARNAPNWDVQGTSLPAIPEPAKKFMTEGAGKGAGLEGPGSQNAGTRSSGTSTPGAGGAPKKAAAFSLRPESGLAPVVCALAVVVSTMFGASFVFLA